MNAVAIPAASIEAMVNPKHLPAYSGAYGSLEGTISVKGDPSPSLKVDTSRCPEAAAMYGKLFREGATQSDGSRQLPDALVVVTGYSGAFLPEREPAKTLTIEKCSYGTLTVDLTFGQKLLVVNKDPKGFYAPYLASSTNTAVMVPPPNGEPITIYPEKPGFTTLLDRMGSPATADVYTMLQPLHTVSDDNGHYRLDHVPVGKLTLNVRLRAINHDVSQPVEIADGVVTHADIVLDYKAPAASSQVDAGSHKGNLR